MSVSRKKNENDSPVISYVRKGYARGVPVPWVLKMGAKIIFSYIGLSYGFWAKLGIFKHGDLAKNHAGIQESFKDHFSAYKEHNGAGPDYCLELGPGDSVGHALSAKAEGVQ